MRSCRLGERVSAAPDSPQIAALQAQDGVMVVAMSSAPHLCVRGDAQNLRSAFAWHLHVNCPDHGSR